MIFLRSLDIVSDTMRVIDVSIHIGRRCVNVGGEGEFGFVM